MSNENEREIKMNPKRVYCELLMLYAERRKWEQMHGFLERLHL